MQQLRFRDPGVAHEKDVNVTAIARSVFVDLRLTAEELEHQGLLDPFHSKDGRGDAANEHIVNFRVSSDGFDLRLLLLGDDDFFKGDVLPFKGMDTKEDIKHGGVFSALPLGADEQDTVCFDAVAGIQTAGQVLLSNADDAFGLDASLHLFGKLLEFNELRVDQMR